jgi:tRNA threonylcarbamoyl adenosine modification protein YeaZ
MKSLVIETSTEAGLLAVLQDGTVVAEKHLFGGPELSKSLGLEVKKLVCFGPFDRIVIGSGPGSYTGIRVGAAMAESLAFGWKIPLYTVSSPTGFAPASEAFAIAIDARSGGILIQENFTTPKLYPLEIAGPLLESYPIIASPHPEKLLLRLPNLKGLVQRRPNPLLLAKHSILAERPDLCYLSS